nr:TMV resistance protein N-like isoform X2 [Ziziphus jujuba var. spinosa]
MASTSASTYGSGKFKHHNFSTYQSHLSSSSSSSSLSEFEYDVFLNFRGDTRKSFTDHLYTDLIRNGIVTFRDDEELDRGKEISPKLLQAIQNSRNSIIPIFYNVNPSVVRHQTGSYAEAFEEHKAKYKDHVEKVNRWRFALTAVANLSGWHLNDRGEAEFIQNIVKDVSRKLDDTSEVLDELDITSNLLNKLKGTYEGFWGEISHQNQLIGTDSCPVRLCHGFKYDVFLSFKGEDTNSDFTYSLDMALKRMGFSTFKDDGDSDEGQYDGDSDEGQYVSSELQQAIEGSRVYIIILSTSYAASGWCLEELVKLHECRKPGSKILPIFYDVDPSVVRHQTGHYAKAFAKHAHVYKTHKGRVERWRSALNGVANLSGWDLCSGSKQEVLPDIVHDVSRKLSDLVGIDSHLKKLISHLHLDSDDVLIIGIFGMAGIGKTTLTESMYENISYKFEVHCFLAHVRQDSRRLGLIAVQQQLLGHVQMREQVLIHDLQHGIDLIRQQFSNRRVLLVLDDVDKSDQLEALAGEADWFGSGSRIIVTTRHKNLLTAKRVDELFECEQLNYEESIQLFSLTAFGKYQPMKGFEMLSKHVVEYANGNPLTLKDIGEFLFGRNINEWIYSLNNIKYIPERLNFETLHMSYDSLDEESKAILLHIACFFNGKKADRVVELLYCFDYHARIGMKVLIDKSFVAISNNILRMHHLTQKMAREIVREECISEPGRRSRLWHHGDINDMMMRNLGTNVTEAIVLDQPELQAHWNKSAFSKLSNLRLLSICSNIHLPGGLEYLPEKLRFFKWRGYPLKSLPSNIYPSELVELNMCHSKIEQLWTREKLFEQLKCINLSHCWNLTETPEFIGVPNLEKLILEGCINLVAVHSSIGVLQRLRFLNLKDCMSLRSLPSYTALESLEICFLSGCSKLDRLDVECSTENPSRPRVKDCSTILSLNRRKCINIASFLSSIPKVTKLSLRNCLLREGGIPSEIGQLTSLEVLDLGRNNFVSLPPSINQLSKLKFFGLSHCKQLESVPGLPSNIEYVEARDCSSLLTFSNPFKVQTSADFVLSFINCYKLTQNQDCKNTIMMWLKAYLQSLLNRRNQELSHLRGRFDIIIPGTRIPEWFRHQNMGPSVRTHLPLNRSNNHWIGFVFCVVFGVHEQLSFEHEHHLDSENPHEINCQLYTDEGPLSNRFGFCISRGTLFDSDHLWLHYMSNGSFGKRMLWWNRITYVDASFGIESQCLEVKKCGFRAVYKQDVEQKKKRKFQYICPPIEDLGVGFFSYDK